MSTFVSRLYTTTCPGKLKDAINANVAIDPECLQVVYDGVSTTYFEFDIPLDGTETTELDSMLASFVCPAAAAPPLDTETAADIQTEIAAVSLGDLEDVEDPNHSHSPEASFPIAHRQYWLKGNPSGDGYLVIEASDIIGINRENGFENLTDSVMSFDDGTRTFTIQPAGSPGSYYFRSDGVGVTNTTSKSIQIPDTEGLHYFYLDGNGDLITTQTFGIAIIETYAYCANVYWDATNNKAILLGEERHGFIMDWATHSYLHNIFNTVYQEGLALTDIIADGDGSLATHCQLGYQGGIIRDEDIKHEIATVAAPAQLPIFYRLGANGDWRRKDPDVYPFIYSGTAGYVGADPDPTKRRIPYNQWTGATWQLTEVSNDDFVCIHYFATNDPAQPIVGVQGQVLYTSANDARAGAATEINTLFLDGMPFVEFVTLGTAVLQTKYSYGNDPNARFIEPIYGETDTYIDWRESTAQAGGGAGLTDHGLLAGIADDDHVQYALAGAGSTRTFDLGDLLDVSYTGSPAPVGGDVLRFNGTNWVNVAETTLPYIPTSEKGAANGVATLDGSGKVVTTQLPALAITETNVVASQAAMLALTAQTGDVAVRTDLNKTFILAGTDPSVLGDWQELLTPTDTVLSVDGRTGAVTLSDLYASVSTTLTAGNGLSGGGDLSTNRSFAVNVKNSIQIDADSLQLVNDAASPGNNKMYGTNGVGARGWYDQPDPGAGVNNLTDLLDVDLTGSPGPAAGDVLTYSGSTWGHGSIDSGATSKRMNTWTLLSADHYYNDFVHNLGTTEIAALFYDYATNVQIRPEYIEFIDANTVRVVVYSNTHDIVCNLVTGRGPTGPQGATGPAGGGMSNVVEDTTPQLGGDLDLNQKNIEFSIPSVNLTTSGFIVSSTVDTNTTGFGAALYMATDGHFDEANATSSATMPCRALAVETGTGTKKVLLQGFIRNDAWNWTPGASLYVHIGTGVLTHVVPSGTGEQVQKVGFAWTADIIYFSPGDYTIVEVA